MQLTKHDLREKIKEYQKKHGTKPVKWAMSILFKWEYELLKDIGAINDRAILAEYPIIKYVQDNGNTKTEDLNGNLYAITEKVEKFNSGVGAGSKTKARIVYYPRGYQMFMEIRREKDMAQMAEKKNINSLARI